MNDQLLRFDKNQKYLVLDTETEGLNLVKSRPYQVSWIIAQGDRVLEKNDRYLWWSDLQMSEGAVPASNLAACRATQHTAPCLSARFHRCLQRRIATTVPRYLAKLS